MALSLFVLCSPDYDKYSEDPEFKPASRHAKDLFEEVRIWSLHIDKHSVEYFGTNQ